MNIKQKITTGLATGAVLLGTIAPAAFAAASVNISGNGRSSDNTVSVSQTHRVDINQSNDARIDNNATVNSNTGGNRANDNVGGDISIRTGDANTAVHISNNANMNHASIGYSNGNGGNGGSGNGGGMLNNWSKLHAFMTGGQEVPGPGDPDGFGTAKVKVRPHQGKLCVSMWVRNIDSATAAHIHEAPAGVAGPVVVTLPTPNAQGFASGCVDVASSELTDIKNNPSDYYVNVHNAPFPGGAVRGQLSN